MYYYYIRRLVWGSSWDEAWTYWASPRTSRTVPLVPAHRWRRRTTTRLKTHVVTTV